MSPGEVGINPMAAHLKSANCLLLSKLWHCVSMSAKRADSSRVPVLEALSVLQDRIMKADAGKSPRFQADQYALNNRLQRKDSNFVLDFCQPTFLQGCHQKMQFLDVGCGTGDFTRECLLPRCLPCRRIVATDWSLDMIKYAKRHWDHVKIDYQQLDISADVTNFLIINGPFHRIYSFYCLHWVKKQDIALKNIARLLTPEGECLLLFPASNPATAGWQLLAKMDRWAKYSEELLAYIAPCEDMVEKQEQIDYMRSLLNDAGLTPSIFALPRMATFDGWTEEDIIERDYADPAKTRLLVLAVPTFGIEERSRTDEAKAPRRAAQLATARIEQSSLKYKLLLRHSQWPSSGDLSSQRVVSQPSNLQHVMQKVPRLAGDDADVPAQSSKRLKSQESPDRVPRQPVLKSDTEDCDDVDNLTQSKKAKLQKSHDKVPRKPMLMSDTEDSDNLDNPTHSKKTQLQKSHDKGPRKLMLKSDTKDSDDVDNLAQSKKAKLQKSCDKVPRKPMLMSDSEESDDVDDPTHSKKVKSEESSDQVSRKPTLGSINRSNCDMQLRHPGKVELKSSSWLAANLKERQNAFQKCEDSPGETAQTSKGDKATFKPISSCSSITQQAGRQSEVPAGTWHHTMALAKQVPYRKPDCKTTNSQYKCSVTGCPHANFMDCVGLWLFPIPDKKEEASLHSAWLQSVPVDFNVNRPLSPRVCFKHFDVEKDFVSFCKRLVGLQSWAVPSKVPPKSVYNSC
ncbi:uncharacterized protein LOC119464985 isoform X4 [Dermacentor silvarum]|uniref:uncharacterized protein LOC119464985 isoform X4 n=1 Tax=Dermacentor silvarum TaxID=543639 RepID=UPI0021010B07|nr:uncharacterized protein LOC119464985 isoform X4 [Dermacentor silvarum]